MRGMIKLSYLQIYSSNINQMELSDLFYIFFSKWINEEDEEEDEAIMTNPKQSFLNSIKIKTKLSQALRLFLIVALVMPLLYYPGNTLIAETELTAQESESLRQELIDELFLIKRKIEDQKYQADQTQIQLNELEEDMVELNQAIRELEDDFDHKRQQLAQVLTSYQRSGAASYFELLFRSQSFSDFLQNLNLLKSFSQNLATLLYEIRGQENLLQIEYEEAQQLEAKLLATSNELTANILAYETTVVELEERLAVLNARSDYEAALDERERLWIDCRKHFASFLENFEYILDTDFMALDENIFDISIFTSSVSISEINFNKIIREFSNYPETKFNFQDNNLQVSFYDGQLILNGSFKILSSKEIEYVVSSASFYDLPLDQHAINDLFVYGPMTMHFDMYSDGALFAFIKDFNIKNVNLTKGKITFKLQVFL